MKFAIIADIHANLEALEAVLSDAKEQGCTHYACLGDVVGYGANPKQCLDIVRDMGMPVVKGNHDEYCSTDVETEGVNAYASAAVDWTRTQLPDEDRQWLRDLKYFRLVTTFSIVHASLDEPKSWPYVFNKLDASSSFLYQNTSVCFFGHTHVPVAFVRDAGGTIRGGKYQKVSIEPGKKYFINIGSVGQPRDGDPRAAYGLFDMDHKTVELRRLEYPIEVAQKKIRDAGLPPRLADRLALGH
ncbi:MAG: metallophosphatase family protein [Verrucomicrobia bacterium]|nr:metallophosphatase family protein [Verrucomicrobiota bacterium]